MEVTKEKSHWGTVSILSMWVMTSQESQNFKNSVRKGLGGGLGDGKKKGKKKGIRQREKSTRKNLQRIGGGGVGITLKKVYTLGPSLSET